MWYHNGSQILSRGRHIISENNTKLTINNLRDYDAGVYKVNFSYSCIYPLPSVAAFVPVMFTVQEHSLPLYDPLTTLPTYYITDISPRIFLNTSVPSQYIRRLYGVYWYKDGVRVSNSNTSTLTTTEQGGLRTGTLDLTGRESAGIYMVALRVRYAYESILFDYICLIADRVDLFYYEFAIGFSIWIVKNYRELYCSLHYSCHIPAVIGGGLVVVQQ